MAVVLAALALATLADGRGLRLKHASLSALIALAPGRVAAGAPISGKLILQNITTKPKVVLSGCGLDGLYAVALRAPDGYIQDPVFAQVACRHKQTLVAKRGTTIYRFKIRGTYTACSQSPDHHWPKRSENWLPLCLKRSSGKREIMPLLPPGKYAALFFSDGTWTGPTVKPATLVVTKHG
ncbi:MAG: hypothetical protein ACP5H2_12455 [Solirubrobacteraceae bacterium]